MLATARERAVAELCEETGLLGESTHGVGETFDVAGLDQQPVHRMLHELRKRPPTCRDDRKTVLKGLDDGAR
jgi:hypothetical protein